MASSVFKPMDIRTSFAGRENFLDRNWRAILIPSTRDYDEEIPMLSHDAFPSVSLDTAGEMKIVPKGEKSRKRHRNKRKKRREHSQITPSKMTIGGQEIHPLIWVEDNDDLPGLFALSDSSRWMSVCPMTGFMKVKSVLDSGATDSYATD